MGEQHNIKSDKTLIKSLIPILQETISIDPTKPFKKMICEQSVNQEIVSKKITKGTTNSQQKVQEQPETHSEFPPVKTESIIDSKISIKKKKLTIPRVVQQIIDENTVEESNLMRKRKRPIRKSAAQACKKLYEWNSSDLIGHGDVANMINYDDKDAPEFKPKKKRKKRKKIKKEKDSLITQTKNTFSKKNLGWEELAARKQIAKKRMKETQRLRYLRNKTKVKNRMKTYYGENKKRIAVVAKA